MKCEEPPTLVLHDLCPASVAQGADLGTQNFTSSAAFVKIFSSPLAATADHFFHSAFLLGFKLDGLSL